jgi:hypothetical protein
VFEIQETNDFTVGVSIGALYSFGGKAHSNDIGRDMYCQPTNQSEHVKDAQLIATSLLFRLYIEGCEAIEMVFIVVVVVALSAVSHSVC